MKQQPQLASMIKGQMFDGFLLTRAAAQKTSSNGSKYLDMTLCDISGEVNAKMWDGLTPAPAVAEVLRVRGMMLEYNGRPQLRVDKMRPATENDDYDMSALTPCAPESAGNDEGRDHRRASRPWPTRSCSALVFGAAGGCAAISWIIIRRLPSCTTRNARACCTTPAPCCAWRAASARSTRTLDADLLAAGVILHDLCKIDGNGRPTKSAWCPITRRRAC